MPHEVIFLKIAALLVIFVAGLLGGHMAHVLHPERPRSAFFFLSEAFIAGIFLGVGLLHMLPNAIRQLHFAHASIDYPLAALLCAFGFLFLFVIERASYWVREGAWAVYFLLLILSVHALIAGLALGLDTQLYTASMLFLAILMHKLSSGYVLGVDLHRASMRPISVHGGIVLFSLMSPLGIGLGLLLWKGVGVHVGLMGEGVFDALVAGTFLYLAMHSAFVRHAKVKTRALESACALTLGVLLMALLALWTGGIPLAR